MRRDPVGRLAIAGRGPAPPGNLAQRRQLPRRAQAQQRCERHRSQELDRILKAKPHGPAQPGRDRRPRFRIRYRRVKGPLQPVQQPEPADLLREEGEGQLAEVIAGRVNEVIGSTAAAC